MNKLQERGAHGLFDPSTNKVTYGTTGQEGRNFLKAVDRYHSKDDWNKNLGGGDSSFLQGPSSANHQDSILGMVPPPPSSNSMPGGPPQGHGSAVKTGGPSPYEKHYSDSEAIEARRMDEASEQGGGVDWEKLGSKQHDPFKTNYSHSDELGPDSEALEEAAMDQASGLQAMSDAYPQGEGDERKQQRMEAMSQERRDRFQDSVPQEEGMWDKVKGLFSSDDDEDEEYKPLSKGKQAAVKIASGLLSGSDQDMPIQRAPLAGVKMGRVAFPNLLASSQRPVNPRYTNKGLG